MVDNSDVSSFIANLPNGFLQCRDHGHNWRPYDAYLFDDGYEVHARCPSCKTVRIRFYDHRGYQTRTPNYRHPDGYLMTSGHGGFTVDDRAQVHLRVAKEMIASKGTKA